MLPALVVSVRLESAAEQASLRSGGTARYCDLSIDRGVPRKIGQYRLELAVRRLDGHILQSA
jgi:hypothetical protein